MERELLVSTTVSRDKLGLALAGGGFRAALFHLGVLRRMAELDLLRRVEVLSTVSGGSIIGALYVLRLKRALEAAPNGNLSREQYIAIVARVEADLLRGIGKNLRTRLFMNPLGVLRVMLTPHSLGRRMARLYERWIYADVVNELEPSSPGRRRLRPGQLPLRALRIHPGGNPMDEGIEAYNQRAAAEGRSVSTRLVLNATSLNAGARFWFSSSEVGDWYLGHVRSDEVATLEERKEWLEHSPEELAELRAAAAPDDEAGRAALALAEWWRHEPSQRPERPPGGYWDRLFALPGVPDPLLDTDLGLLRQAKLPAWYLVYGSRRTPPVTGGLDPEGHRVRLRGALENIHDGLGAVLERGLGDDPLLPRFLLELYWLRTAAVVSKDVRRFWQSTSRVWQPTSVGEAVGASANFPPVFPPFQVLGLYDDLHVSRLGLTDGGVFDNMGLTALVDEGCTQIIASDTSGLFEETARVSPGRLTMMARIVAVLQKVVAGNQRKGMRERRRVSKKIEPAAARDADWARFLASRKLRDLAYFHIDSDPVDPRDGVEEGHRAMGEYTAPADAYDNERRRQLAKLRTDLDAFSELEVAALVNHGHNTADRYIRRYFTPKGEPGSLWQESWDDPPPAPPTPIVVPDDRVTRTLRAGASRVFRALRVGAKWSWAVSVLLVGALIAWTWSLDVSVAGAVGGLGDGAVWALHAMAPWLGADWTGRAVPLGQVLAGAVVLLVVVPWLTGRTLGAWWASSRRARKLAGRIATVGKWGRSLVGNLLWVFGAFPVLLALGASVLAAISHVCYTLPYIGATRNRPRS